MQTSRAFFQLIVITRSWNAGHGGVYVLITEETQPNPYLDDPQRDLTTVQGLALTKINPAFMTRQISEIAAREDGVQFHITSLKPLRPANSPTEWEAQSLHSFEQGSSELGEFFDNDQHPSFRYMAPLFVTQPCLKCHASQGYKLGDLRGGISVTLPEFQIHIHASLFYGYGLAAIGGLLFILFGGGMLRKKSEQLSESNQALSAEILEREKLIRELTEVNEQVKTLSGIVPICMYCKEIRDDQGYWNQLEKFISQHSEAQFSHSICPKCMHEKYPDLEDDPDEKD